MRTIRYHEKRTHDMGPVKKTTRGGRFIRTCSCGWRAYGDRADVMAESASHRNSVRAFAKLVARGKAEFYTPPPRELSAEEKANLAAYSDALRHAFRKILSDDR